ncbi:LacI family DNA-binding transcriptional regulator [Arthrobacter sp. UYCo732]|uniref:LacI family DNA-binding transcriptional regulator n=1 Tax=Arthrobacter sp. UYCo732 TaxID=3156336 RepID=UPI0033970AE3
MSGKNVGIKDVAAAAGVSATTVSHVLNNVASARISRETRERVRSAAGQLGYGPDSVARALRTSRTALLGLAIEDIGAGPHAGQIILGADEAARARGYHLVVINVPASATDGSASDESREAGVESLLKRRVDGIMYAPLHFRQLPGPANLGSVPAVLVNAVSTNGSIAAVVPDHDGGARDAVRCLLAAGHTRIGFINNADGTPAAQDRLSGFRGALSAAGLDGGAAPVDSVPLVSAPPAESAQPLEQGGYEAARRMLARANRPTGLVCHDDRVAMGAYRAAAELGLAIPANLSVVALADREGIGASLYPALTTVALPLAELAARAAEILMDAIEDTSDTARRANSKEVTACLLVKRGSVAPPRGTATPRGNF